MHMNENKKNSRRKSLKRVEKEKINEKELLGRLQELNSSFATVKENKKQNNNKKKKLQL